MNIEPVDNHTERYVRGLTKYVADMKDVHSYRYNSDRSFLRRMEEKLNDLQTTHPEWSEGIIPTEPYPMERYYLDALSNYIRYHQQQYYEYDTSLISDFEFDSALRRLSDLEKTYPHWVSPRSPVTTVGH